MGFTVQRKRNAREALELASRQIKSDWEVKEFVKCALDYAYAITNYVKVPNHDGVQPFKLYPYQIASIYHLMTNKKSIFLKSRQMGITTLLAAYALLEALTKSNQKIIIISIRESSGKKILELIKFMYYNLPHFLKITVTNSVGERIGTATELRFANGSTIEVMAATESAGRGIPATLVIFDELAFQMHANEIWTSLQPTLAFTKGQVIMNSTPFGVGNLYSEIYQKAIRKSNDFKALKLHWSMHPLYDTTWYDLQVKDLGVRRASQELDCTFLNSGSPVFDIPTLRSIDGEIKSNFNYSRFAEQPDGMGGYFYKNPTKNGLHVVGVDIATGTARDSSAFSVVSVEEQNEIGFFKGKLRMGDLADLTIRIARKCGNAMIAPENNGLGEGFVELLLDKQYTNIYMPEVIQRPSENRYEASSMDKYGFNTNVRTRDKVIEELDSDLIHNNLGTMNKFFVKEGFSFVYDSNNKPVAKDKIRQRASQHNSYGDGFVGDDSIMALAIGNHVAKKQRRTVHRHVLKTM